MAFTAAELEEMRRADEEIEADFRLCQDDLDLGRELDRLARFDAKEPEARRVAAQKKAYREANREKVNAYMREYRRKKKSAAGDAANITGGKKETQGGSCCDYYNTSLRQKSRRMKNVGDHFSMAVPGDGRPRRGGLLPRLPGEFDRVASPGRAE